MSGKYNLRRTKSASLESSDSSSDMDLDSDGEIAAIGDLLLSNNVDVKPDISQLRQTAGVPLPIPMDTSANCDQSSGKNRNERLANCSEAALKNVTVTKETLQSALNYVEMHSKKTVPQASAGVLLDQPSTSSGVCKLTPNFPIRYPATDSESGEEPGPSQNDSRMHIINFDAEYDHSVVLDTEIEGFEAYDLSGDNWVMDTIRKKGEQYTEHGTDLIDQYVNNICPTYKHIYEQMEPNDEGGIASPLASPTGVKPDAKPNTMSNGWDEPMPPVDNHFSPIAPTVLAPPAQPIPPAPVPQPLTYQMPPQFTMPPPLLLDPRILPMPVPSPYAQPAIMEEFIRGVCNEIIGKQVAEGQLQRSTSTTRDPRLGIDLQMMNVQKPPTGSATKPKDTARVEKSNDPDVKDPRYESTATIYKKPIKYVCKFRSNRDKPMELPCKDETEWRKTHTPPVTAMENETENVEGSMGQVCGDPLVHSCGDPSGRKPINYANSLCGSSSSKFSNDAAGSRNSSPQFSDQESSNSAHTIAPAKIVSTANTIELEEPTEIYAPSIPEALVNRRISINMTEACRIPAIDHSDNDTSGSNTTIEFPYDTNQVMSIVEKEKAAKEKKDDAPAAETDDQSVRNQSTESNAKATVSGGKRKLPGDDKKCDEAKSPTKDTDKGPSPEKRISVNPRRDSLRNRDQAGVTTRNSTKSPQTDASRSDASKTKAPKQKSTTELESSSSSLSTRRKKLMRTRSTCPKRSISESSASETENDTSGSGQPTRKLRSTTKKRRAIEKPESKAKPITRSSRQTPFKPIPLKIKTEPTALTSRQYSDGEQILPETSDDNQIRSPDPVPSSEMPFNVPPVVETTTELNSAVPNKPDEGNDEAEKIVDGCSTTITTDDCQQDAPSGAKPINTDVEMAQNGAIPEVGAEVKIEEPPNGAPRTPTVQLPAEDDAHTVASDDEEMEIEKSDTTEFLYASGSESAGSSLLKRKSTDEDVSFNDASNHVNALNSAVENDDDSELIPPVAELTIPQSSADLAEMSKTTESASEIPEALPANSNSADQMVDSSTLDDPPQSTDSVPKETNASSPSKTVNKENQDTNNTPAKTNISVPIKMPFVNETVAATAPNEAAEDVKDIKPDVSHLVTSPYQENLRKLVEARRNQGLGQRRLADCCPVPDAPEVVDLDDSESGNDTDRTTEFDESAVREPGKFVIPSF